MYWSSCKLPVVLVIFLKNLNFLDGFSNTNFKFHEHPPSGSSVAVCGRRDRQT